MRSGKIFSCALRWRFENRKNLSRARPRKGPKHRMIRFARRFVMTFSHRLLAPAGPPASARRSLRQTRIPQHDPPLCRGDTIRSKGRKPGRPLFPDSEALRGFFHLPVDKRAFLDENPRKRYKTTENPPERFMSSISTNRNLILSLHWKKQFVLSGYRFSKITYRTCKFQPEVRNKILDHVFKYLAIVFRMNLGHKILSG